LMLWCVVGKSFNHKKIPWLCITKEHSKTATSSTNWTNWIFYKFLGIWLYILLETIKILCRKYFKRIDHIDCRIIVFEVTKRPFLCTFQTRVNKLWIPLPKNFCTTQSSGSLWYVKKLSWKSRKKNKNRKNLYFQFFT
jgi:hypothetical protein